MNVWDRQLQAPTLDRLVYLFLHRLSLMGEHDRQFLRSQIQPGATVVDVGSNIGLYTLLLAELAGDSGKVLAFEPDPGLFEALSLNCQINKVRNVQLFNQALGAESETRTLFRSILNSGDNRMVQHAGSGSGLGSSVQVSRLDEVLAGQKIDFIKIDVQGWEQEVFRGMARLLAENPSVRIYFEYWPYGLRRSGCEPQALLDYLHNLSFDLFEVEKGALIPIRDRAAFDAKLTGSRFTNVFARRHSDNS